MIIRAAMRAHKFKRRLCRKFMRRARADHNLNCTSCDISACCYQMTMCGLFEGVLIANELRELGRDDVMRDLVKTGHMQFRQLRANGWKPSVKLPERATARWFDLEIPCPLLLVKNDQRDRCLCYQIRPAACAVHVSVCVNGITSESCKPPSGKPVAIINAAVVHTHLIWADSQFASEALGKEMLISPMPTGIMVELGNRIINDGPDQALLGLESEGDE